MIHHNLVLFLTGLERCILIVQVDLSGVRSRTNQNA